MKLAAILASILMVGSLSFAADAENSASTTVDHSKNPITGTEKTVKKSKKKMKGAEGKATEEVKETTKVDKDGKVDQSTEVKTESKDK